jgi:O-antigen/teichoic acid export membrane protein
VHQITHSAFNCSLGDFDPVAIETPPPEKRAPSGSGDYLTILSGTSQNVVGIIVAAAATFAANVLMARNLAPGGFGIVTMMTQGAFVLSFATRAGMDMAVLRDVAMEVGVARYGRIRVPVARAALVALVVSTVVALIGILLADQIRSLLRIDDESGRWVVEVACAGLPFLALSNVWLSATRGLKIMRYTLYIFWAGQPLTWILFMLIGWQFSKTAWMSALAYSASWAWASVAAYLAWRKECRAWTAEPMETGDMARLMRYAGPRAPAALFSQLLFWTDLFVVARYVGEADVDVYSAALRAGQVLLLFLTSVSLMFSPFVADLHNRGETKRLDGLFKSLTRWTLAATLPAFLILVVVPAEALRIFGSDFSRGETALLILLAGQFVNVLTGSVGFVLIMVGRTGWDLIVYGASLALNLVMAFALAPRYGLTGAAIANAVTFALSKWARLALVKRFVDIQPYDRHYFRLIPPTAAAAAAMVAVHAVADGWGWAPDLVATGVVGTLVFAGAYLVFGLTPQERRGVSNLIADFRGRRGVTGD